MNDDEYDTTIGTGGWILVGLSGVVAFGVLRAVMQYHLFPAVVFAVALALIVLLVLYRLAAAVNRYEAAEESQRVRRIVPADQGAAHAGPVAKVMPVRPETATPVAQRPSSVVTPLAKVEAAPIIAPPPPATDTDTVETARPAPILTLVESVAKPVAKPKAETRPKAKPAAKPKAGKTAAKAAAKPGAAKPAGLVRLKAARKGKADDLKEIEGVGPALEKLVNSLGFYHFDQIAGWTEADVALVDAEMKTFKGRIARDKWVEQARIIVTDGLEAFRERAKTNEY